MKTIKAKEAFGTPYMTKEGDTPIEERMYWRELTGAAPSTEGLRGATAEEYNAWREALDRLAAEPMIEEGAR